MKAIDYAKEILIQREKEFENYLQKRDKYLTYCALPWHKRIFGTRVEEPDFHTYNDIRVWSGALSCINLRIYYSGTSREITLAINELNNGFMLNVETGEKSSYLGRVGTDISDSIIYIAENIRKEIAPLVVE